MVLMNKLQFHLLAAKTKHIISLLKHMLSLWFMFRKTCAYFYYLNYEKGRTFKFCHGRLFA